jgi:hypothetical protein
MLKVKSQAAAANPVRPDSPAFKVAGGRRQVIGSSSLGKQEQSLEQAAQCRYLLSTYSNSLGGSK